MRTIDEIQQIYLATIPDSSRGIVAKALRREGGRANAIRAKCLTCTGCERRKIENCTDVTCSLWAYRPRFPCRTEKVISEDNHEIEYLPAVRSRVGEDT